MPSAARTPKKRKKVRLKEKRKRLRVFLVGVFGVVFVFGIFAGIYVLRLPEVVIQNVSIEGVTYTRADLVETLTRELLSGTYLFIIPRSNTFLYPQKEIETKIKNAFHTVDSVRVQKQNFTSLTIQVTDRVPNAYWCSGKDDAALCYLMDKDGFVFLKQKEKKESFVVYAGYFLDEPLGKTYLDGNFVSLREFIDDIKKAAKRTPSNVYVSEYNDVSVSFLEGGEMRYAFKEQNVTLLDNVASVFSSRRFADGDVLEYADFRFGNNVYVKFVGDE